ncbi:protein of unknown function (plasmid) [Denitratisoma oestradiolicum]|uniref:Uncharacterized protein n=1 Tax=Denitratisoma oestradiolicum TaxID=311182 RepID=A0A6S6Y701_9PROT|nr:protein of unknown function [Denitratisoma oestradiolicum]
MQLASRFRNATGTRADRPLSDEEIRAVAPRSSLRPPTKAALRGTPHSDHRRAEWPAPRGLPALHGLPNPCPRRRQARAHQAHDPPASRRPDRRPGGERNHPAEQPRRHEQLSDARRHVPLRLPERHGVRRTTNDIRVRHNGDVVGEVIEGAFKVLDSFETIGEQREAMQALTVNPGEAGRLCPCCADAQSTTRTQAPRRSLKPRCWPAPLRGPPRRYVDHVQSRARELAERWLARPQPCRPDHDHAPGQWH